MKVLVTGGAGYIGSHACKSLAAAGFVPVVYDNLVYGHEWSVKWGPLIEGDLHDQDLLAQVLVDHKPIAVMHFAAYAYVGESVTNPAKYYQNNVVGTLSLLEQMRRAQISNIVFSSTCATYGVPDTVPITEGQPQVPINPYGRSKLMIEQCLQDYYHAYNMKGVSLRYFNAAGADPQSEIGESHDPETHLIPLVLDAATGARPSISVFGTDYDTPDGTCIRDYIHVTDLAQAHVLALKGLLDEAAMPLAYNLGNGTGFSVANVIETCRQVTGRPIEVVLGDRRAGDPAVLVGDASRIRNDLGWSPEFAELEAIVETAWRWHNRQVSP